MDLSFQSPGEHHYVRSVSGDGICIVDTFYTHSLLVSAGELINNWPPQSFDELEAVHLDAIFDLQPDLVLLGTGAKQHFPAADFMMEFYRRGVGIEVMATAPACRTFNVLVAESRRVVAALMPVQSK